MEEHNIEIPEESELQKKVKKAARFAMGVFLLILMISYLIPSNITGSLIEGKKIINYQISAGNKTIIFEPKVYENLKTFYFQNQLSEVSFCLTGNTDGNIYLIDSFYVPETFFKTPITVSSLECKGSTVISMHTHPFNDCLLSRQDIITYKEYIKRHPNSLGGVMCNTDRFAFYG